MSLAKRIGIVGTFDVENFGDLLFPIIAETELVKRLPGMTLLAYSYNQKSTSAWPFDVRSLDDLAREIESLDLLIVGGGHLVRFDKNVADGYAPPPELDLHHPTGYWLMPTLLAAGSGVPVVWNAVGVSPDTPPWATSLLRVAIESVELVSVREPGSVEELGRISEGTNVRLVPDSAFGVASVLHVSPTPAFERWVADHKLHGPYVIVQPSLHLRDRRERVRAELEAAAALGYLVLELPVSPALGDEVGLLDLDLETIQATRWPEPLLLAEIITNAEAIVTRSLHASIVALVSGVPVHRFRSDPDPKYRILDAFEGVSLWDDSTTCGRLTDRIGRSVPAPDVHAAEARLGEHWDDVASCARDYSAPHRRGQHLAALVGRLTAEIERAESSERGST
ncbi:MAG: polysaccharide pyruvyl transferase family protein [Thermoleophilia bacterium]|nr:polysaccharide pyruvyl transferase family protein [Thermoleophilia bacterium]